MATLSTHTANILNFMEKLSGKVDQIIGSQSVLKADVENVRLLVAVVQDESLQYYEVKFTLGYFSISNY